MKKILFATTNESKSKRFSGELLENGIEVFSLKDINLKLDIKEDGKDIIENALIKAREAYRISNMPTIGMDDSLYLENVPKDIQPGLCVRRVNNKTLTDDEMLEYYINLVKKYGKNGRINCKWIYGIAVINEKGEENTYSWSKEHFYMVDTKSSIINPGYPLNSISKYKIIGKYFTEITEEDKEKIKISESDVVAFIIKNMK